MSRYDESQLTRLPRGEESTGSASAKRRRFAIPLPEVPPTEPTVTGTVGDPTGGAAPELRRGQRAPLRKRRSRWLSLVRPAATAIFLVALPTAVGLWLLTSPRFALAELEVTVDVGVGAAEATVWTCDLTHGYISINADYRS